MHMIIGVAAFLKVLRCRAKENTLDCVFLCIAQNSANVEGIEIQTLCGRSQSLAEMEKIPRTAT